MSMAKPFFISFKVFSALSFAFHWFFIAGSVTMAFSSASSITRGTTASFILRVRDSGVASVNTEYYWTSSKVIPPGFAKVCQQNNWNVESTWSRLNGDRDWLRAPSNEAYIYQNSADGHWWIDEPGGLGVFIAPVAAAATTTAEAAENGIPPTIGWRALAKSYEPLPTIEAIFTPDSKLS